MIKLPTLKGLKPTGPKLGSLPVGRFRCKIERCWGFTSRAGRTSIRVEVTVLEIVKQDAFVNPETKISNEVKVGDRRETKWFEMGGQYGYGEQEWAGFLQALGATDDTIDAAQEAALSAENPLRDQEIWINHTLQSKSDGGVFVKPSFESV